MEGKGGGGALGREPGGRDKGIDGAATAPELVQERLVQKEVDVLDVVVGLVEPIWLLLGLARVNPLENAEPAADGRRKAQAARLDDRTQEESQRWRLLLSCACHCPVARVHEEGYDGGRTGTAGA